MLPQSVINIECHDLQAAIYGNIIVLSLSYMH